jgi:sugar phosphate isomerase/epimerase
LQEEYGRVELIVHVPLQKVSIVTRRDFDREQVSQAIVLAHELGAHAVVMHRYWGLTFGDSPPRCSRDEAIAGFSAVVSELAREAGALTLFVENVGHYSLLPRDGQHYLCGPLDHFFPWEIAEFHRFLAAKGLHNVAVLIDVAHATLSSNLFNLAHRVPSLRTDPRFRWILEDDLARSPALHPFDFLDQHIRHLHVSDSRLLSEAELQTPNLPEEMLTAAICSEGLEVGRGNLPWTRLRERVPHVTSIVLEVDPGAGETHVENGAQERSLVALKNLFA